jgi:hypothetical protein
MLIGTTLNSAESVETDYGLDGRGNEFWCGRETPHPPERPRRPPSQRYNRHRVFPAGSGFEGLVVSMLASGTRVRCFKHGQSRRIFPSVKIFRMPSFGSRVPRVADLRHDKKKTLVITWKLGPKANSVGHFSPELSSFAYRGPYLYLWSPRSNGMEYISRKLKERCTEGQFNTGLGAYGATRPLNQSIYLSSG